MARKPRIHYPGAIYHVIARGNNREAVFRETEDKQKYLSLIDKYKTKYQFRLFAYVLMDNHVHLLVAIGQEPLAKIMQGIQQSYTQYYNRKYERVGHVFEQRYKAKLCKEDSYLLNLLRYIHLNPVRAHVTPDAEYNWSSHSVYKNGESSWVETNYLLAFFSQNKQSAIKQYIQFMEQAGIEDESIESGEVYLEDQELPRNDTIPEVKNISFDEILDIVAKETGVTTERILRDKYDRQVVQVRDIVIYLAIQFGVMTKTELSRILPLSLVGIIKSYNKVHQEEKLHQKAEELCEKFSW